LLSEVEADLASLEDYPLDPAIPTDSGGPRSHPGESRTLPFRRACYDHTKDEGASLMTIGQLAREAGIRPSAVRYYESLGLMPAPERRAGRREYTDSAVAHLAVVQFALATGFTLRETRQLVQGFSAGTPASARWRALADVKLREMEMLIARAEAMKRLLSGISRCRCGTLVECGRGLARRRDTWADSRRARRA
jgi:MerR family redox-sensitive transcriptional activator SoxR